jgi:iron-sulfur cluster repair protein YtfE (RIC family)
MLPEDGNVMPKHEAATIHNNLNEKLLHLLVFYACINQMHGSRSKIPSKISRQAALRGGI